MELQQKVGGGEMAQAALEAKNELLQRFFGRTQEVEQQVHKEQETQEQLRHTLDHTDSRLKAAVQENNELKIENKTLTENLDLLEAERTTKHVQLEALLEKFEQLQAEYERLKQRLFTLSWTRLEEDSKENRSPAGAAETEKATAQTSPRADTPRSQVPGFLLSTGRLPGSPGSPSSSRRGASGHCFSTLPAHSTSFVDHPIQQLRSGSPNVASRSSPELATVSHASISAEVAAT